MGLGGEELCLLRTQVIQAKEHFEVQATTTRPPVTATAEGEGVVSHAVSRLLADVADRTTLTAELGEALVGLRKPRSRHDPGRALVDMAVADGARTISNVAVPAA